MQSIGKAATLALLPTCLLGCATVSEKAAKVQLHGQGSTVIASCQRLAPLTVRESRFMLSAEDFLSAKLREAAAAVGADSAVVLTKEETLTEIVVQGVAYKCFGVK